MYLIWSYEHDGWWKENSTGYTDDVEQAGLYTEEQASQICNEANLFGKVNEVMRKAEDYGR